MVALPHGKFSRDKNNNTNKTMNFVYTLLGQAQLPDVSQELATIQGYATNAIVAGVAIAGAWMGWKLIKRFIRG